MIEASQIYMTIIGLLLGCIGWLITHIIVTRGKYFRNINEAQKKGFKEVTEEWKREIAASRKGHEMAVKGLMEMIEKRDERWQEQFKMLEQRTYEHGIEIAGLRNK